MKVAAKRKYRKKDDADKTSSKPLSWANRWALFHLVHGGMTSRREIQEALGVRIECEESIDKIYVECRDAVAAVHELAKPVWCGYCCGTTNIVPCPTCRSKRRGDNFKARPIRDARVGIGEILP